MFSEWAAWILLVIVAGLLALVGIRLPSSLLVVLGIILMIAVYLIRYLPRGDRRQVGLSIASSTYKGCSLRVMR
jgi:membrane protein implicated in regulation of membrane protease activity